MNTQVDIKLASSQIVALTLWGESRGLDMAGRIAVGLVIAHRVADPRFKYGEGWAEVCMRPYQFSCWQEISGKENAIAVRTLAMQVEAGTEPKGATAWTECLWVVEGIMEGAFVDTVQKATHYLTRTLYEQKPPGWAKGQTPVATIGPHVFFRL